jgi:FkbM family methyltransferase
VFDEDSNSFIFKAAIGAENKEAIIHVAKSDDSSSLLPISDLQNEIFAGTAEVAQETIDVGTLDFFVKPSMIASPAMLKLDVQGYELESLKGCEKMIHNFKYIYCECSFVELYVGQSLAHDCIKWLQDRGFRLIEIVNPVLDHDKSIIQADMLFVIGR